MNAVVGSALVRAVGRAVRPLGPGEIADLQRLFEREGIGRAEMRAGVASLLARTPQEWDRVAQVFDRWLDGELDAEGRFIAPAAGASAGVIRPAPPPAAPPPRRTLLVDRLLRLSPARLLGLVLAGIAGGGGVVVIAGLLAAPQVIETGVAAGPGESIDAPAVATVTTIVEAEAARTIDAPLPLRLSPGAYAILASSSVLLALAGARLRRLPDVAARQEATQREASERASREQRLELESERLRTGAPPVDLWEVPVFPAIEAPAIASAASSLARLRIAEGRPELDVPETIARSVRAGGRFDPALPPRTLPRAVLVLLEVPPAGEHPWLHRLTRMLDGLAALGVELDRWTYQEQPDQLQSLATGLRLSTVDLARRTAGWPVLVLGRGLSAWGRDGRRQRPWVGARRAWGPVAWIDPDSEGAAERGLEGLDVARFPFSEAGLERAAEWLVGQRRGAGADDPSLPDSPAVEEALWRWAVAAALVPEATWDQLEAIRRGFPEIGAALPGPWAVRGLIRWVEARTGESAVADSGAALHLSPAFVDVLLTRYRSRADPALVDLYRRVDAMLLDQLGAHAPEDAVARHLWEMKTGWIRARMEPERAAELLGRVLEGPYSAEVKRLVDAELKRQEAHRVEGAQWSEVDTRVLAAVVSVPEGVPLRSVLWTSRGVWPRWWQGLGVVAALVAVGFGAWAGLPALGRLGIAPRVSAVLPASYTLESETGELRPRMIRVKAGSFVMGSLVGEADRGEDEAQHPVRITRDFLLAETEVTQAQYRRVLKEAPFEEEFMGVSLIGDDLPAHNVSWEQAVRYCNALSIEEKLTPAYDLSADPPTWNRDANGYRLPTEAEWEFAARAGTQTRFVGTDDPAAVCARDNVTDLAMKRLSEGATVFPCDDGFPALAPVTYGVPVSGIYGMGGNVLEWVWDTYTGTPPSGDDPVVSEGVFRVSRGGSWFDLPRDARVAGREYGPPSNRGAGLGFRPARSLPP